jgi:hypothetical protein
MAQLDGETANRSGTKLGASRCLSALVGCAGVPKYFFNVVMDKVVVYDRQGRDLADAQAARLFAVYSARELLSRNAKKKRLNPDECSIDVCDGSGNVLCVVPFSEVSHPPQPH